MGLDKILIILKISGGNIMTIREQLEKEMDKQEIKELEGNSVDDNKECNKMDNSNTNNCSNAD